MVQYDVKRVQKGNESFMVSFDFTKTPIVQIADYIIIAASKLNSSDIHFDPREDGMMVRFRIDGDCQDYAFIPKAYEKNLTTRLKLLANMNITESRLPQDGAIKGNFGDQYLDMRVSALPLNEGEKIVIRILDYSRSLQGIESLGFHPKNLEKIKRMMELPNGIILTTGATGSGKSTTTYSILSGLNKPETNIITVEDPIEMNIEGINQVQVNAEIGMTFAAALRSILRQDPNVILIGEIRDSETAQIAVRASITGHLVLSTIHTNNALATVERLLDMNVERYLLSTAMSGIISQRLGKMLCQTCRYQREPTKYEKKVFKKFMNYDVKLIWDANPKGCEHCRRGYKGRIAFHEVLEIDDVIRGAISNEETTKKELAKMVYSHGTISMLQDALIKCLEGKTSFEEIYKNIEIENEDDDNYEAELESEVLNNIPETPAEKEQKENHSEDLLDGFKENKDDENNVANIVGEAIFTADDFDDTKSKEEKKNASEEKEGEKPTQPTVHPVTTNTEPKEEKIEILSVTTDPQLEIITSAPTEAPTHIERTTEAKVIVQTSAPTEAPTHIEHTTEAKVIVQTSAPTEAPTHIEHATEAKLIVQTSAPTEAPTHIEHTTEAKVVPQTSAPTEAPTHMEHTTEAKVVPQTSVPTEPRNEVLTEIPIEIITKKEEETEEPNKFIIDDNESNTEIEKESIPFYMNNVVKTEVPTEHKDDESIKTEVPTEKERIPFYMNKAVKTEAPTEHEDEESIRTEAPTEKERIPFYMNKAVKTEAPTEHEDEESTKTEVPTEKERIPFYMNKAVKTEAPTEPEEKNEGSKKQSKKTKEIKKLTDLVDENDDNTNQENDDDNIEETITKLIEIIKETSEKNLNKNDDKPFLTDLRDTKNDLTDLRDTEDEKETEAPTESNNNEEEKTEPSTEKSHIPFYMDKAIKTEPPTEPNENEEKKTEVSTEEIHIPFYMSKGVKTEPPTEQKEEQSTKKEEQKAKKVSKYHSVLESLKTEKPDDNTPLVQNIIYGGDLSKTNNQVSPITPTVDIKE